MGDLRDLVAAARREARAWRDDRYQLGLKNALLRRLRYHAGAEHLAEVVDQLAQRVGATEGELAAASASLALTRRELAVTGGRPRQEWSSSPRPSERTSGSFWSRTIFASAASDST